MADDIFPKLFCARQQRIHAADAAAAEAARVFGEAKTGDNQRLIRAAARRCEKAATLYQQAGLGLLAKELFAEAARYHSLGGDSAAAQVNQERWSAVSTYWEDDETGPQQTKGAL